jgi:pyrroline-5-carboxylate reductase
MEPLPPITILGTGSMGGAILAGLTGPGVSVDGRIRVTNRSIEKARPLASAAVESFALAETPNANRLAVRGARLVVIGVKPVMVPDLLREIADDLDENAIVVSVAAAVTTATMESLVTGSVLRAMPNTPAFVGKAVTGLAAGSRATPDDLAMGRRLFETIGTVLEVPESKIDALSTISGSGPAYVFYFVEELTRTAIGMGFSAEQAEIMVNGTFLGAAELLASSGVTPAELRRRVTSPKGTTERAIEVLQSADLTELFDRATAAALARAKEMAAG